MPRRTSQLYDYENLVLILGSDNNPDDEEP